MSDVSLLSDSSGRALQSVALAGTPAKITIAASSARVAIPTVHGETAKVVRLASNGNCYIAFGDNAVAATSDSTLFPQGVEIQTVPKGATHVAAIQDGSATGTFQITAVI